MIKSCEEMVQEAEREIKTISVNDAMALLGDENVQFIDIRDIRELNHEGTIEGAFHAPRGMLEFWVDPKSTYHKPVFSSGKDLVLFCAAGWRSALATKTLVDMGLENVCHIAGGFIAWREAKGAIGKKSVPDNVDRNGERS